MGKNDKRNKKEGRGSSGKTKASYSHSKASSKKSSKKGGAPKNKSEHTLKSIKEGLRLNKFVGNSGLCSRRDADIYIAAGNVTVNGKVITEMGYKVKLSDEVKFDGQRIYPEKPEYVLLNKPKGFYVTGNSEEKNKTVMQLVANASGSKISPVGKLETQAMGLLLFTNDGALAKKLAIPKNGIRQIYHVELNKDLSLEDRKKIEEGILIKGTKIKVNDISFIENRPHRELGIELKSTKNHIVQSVFKSLEYEVVKLDRVVFGGLTKKDLPRGHWRKLNAQEVINLNNL